MKKDKVAWGLFVAFVGLFGEHGVGEQVGEQMCHTVCAPSFRCHT